MSILQLSSKSQIDALLEELEKCCHTKYITNYSSKYFNDENWQPSEKDKIMFEKKSQGKKIASIPFIGFPYIYIGSRYLLCHQGKERNKARKPKEAERRRKSGVKERPNMFGKTKKIDCPAVINITRVASLTDKKFQIDKNSKHIRQVTSDLVKNALGQKESIPVKWEDFYYVYVSHLEDHNHECNPPIKLKGKAASTKEKTDQKGERKMKDRKNVNSDELFFNDSHDHKQDDDQQYYQESRPMVKSIEKEPNISALRMMCANEHKSILNFINLIEDESCLRNLRCSLEDLKNSLVAHVPLEEVVINVDSAYCLNVD